MLYPEIPAHLITNMGNGLVRVVSEQCQFQVIGRNRSFHHLTFPCSLMFRVMIIIANTMGKSFCCGLAQGQAFQKVQPWY
jgi:hypothetical protein